MIHLDNITVQNEVFHKPKGGFWTSTYTPKDRHISSWVEWCSSEQPDWLKGKYYILYPKKEIKIYKINNYDDLKYIFEKYPYYNKEHEAILRHQHFIDWEKVAKDYDAVQITEKGELIARGNCTFFLQDGYSLYGWDCESTVWFRNVFDEIKLLKEVKNV